MLGKPRIGILQTRCYYFEKKTYICTILSAKEKVDNIGITNALYYLFADANII